MNRGEGIGEHDPNDIAVAEGLDANPIVALHGGLGVSERWKEEYQQNREQFQHFNTPTETEGRTRDEEAARGWMSRGSIPVVTRCSDRGDPPNLLRREDTGFRNSPVTEFHRVAKIELR